MISRAFKLKDFDGPLDLLLTLIGKAQIDIKDIFVSEITDQYLEIVRNAQDLDMDEASDFLLMAATLLEIKSRALLPKPPKPEDETDPEEELIRRLEEIPSLKWIRLLYTYPEEVDPALMENVEFDAEGKELSRSYEPA